MTAQQRTGLIAFGMVGGLFLGVIVLVVVLANVGKDKGTNLADRPMSSGASSDDEAYIRGHRWWKKQLSKGEFDAIMKAFLNSTRADHIFIDGNGKMVISYAKSGITIIEPEGLDRRRFTILCKWEARPTREQVFAVLREQLDTREYRDGPGH